jgi:tRNA A-37 threonylcarbamoyl transferase component Bud32
MDKARLLEELSAGNPLYSWLLEDWMDVGSYSFWRFFPTEASLREWDRVVRGVMDRFGCKGLVLYKSDVVGMVLVLDQCVVRTYRTARFLRIRPLYRLRSPYLERCWMSRQLGHVGVFVCKRVRPLVDAATMTLSMGFTPPLFEQLLGDVGKAIHKVHSYGYCHKDVSLDNTGYDEETRRFVLFDFDAAAPMALRDRDSCRDRVSFEASLHTWADQLGGRKLQKKINLL